MRSGWFERVCNEEYTRFSLETLVRTVFAMSSRMRGGDGVAIVDCFSCGLRALGNLCITHLEFGATGLGSAATRLI